MSAIADQTAGPNWLNFLRKPIGTMGVTKATPGISSNIRNSCYIFGRILFILILSLSCLHLLGRVRKISLSTPPKFFSRFMISGHADTAHTCNYVILKIKKTRFCLFYKF